MLSAHPKTLRQAVSTLLAGAALTLGGCSAVPEVGMLFDRDRSQTSVIIRLKEQKAYLYRNGRVVGVSSVSTGREGYSTPAGKYRVTEKDVDHRSSLYGSYVKNGRVVKSNVNVRRDRKPAGATFVGAPMPYFVRINGPVGLHAGHVPGYAASHGCIRLPSRQARRFFHAVEIGTPVFVYR